jgi:FkbH-like protein
MITVPEIGNDPAEFVRVLAGGRYFEAWSISQEDRQRTESYTADAERERLLRGTASEAEYLRDLHMVCTHGPFDEVTLPRVAQLVGKTNQFNLTSRRHSLEELRRVGQDERNWTQWFRLRDRFGDSGIIGVIVALADGHDAWQIDTLLMSCRVMGRGMEQFMIQTLVTAAENKRIRKLFGKYHRTSKNSVVSEFYTSVGFRQLAATTVETLFELPMGAVQLPAMPIEDVSTP